MDGFNVLNEIPGTPIAEIYGWGVIFICLFSIGIALTIVSIAEGEVLAALCGLPLAVIFGIILLNGGAFRETGEVSPTQYEVTLKPGAVIDATRWNIVNQRGEIYVIQERKHDAN